MAVGVDIYKLKSTRAHLLVAVPAVPVPIDTWK